MDRLSRFWLALEKGGASAALIAKPENMRYLSNYTGEGALFVSKDSAIIITDFRYIEQAEREAPGMAIEQITGDIKLEAVVKRLTENLKIDVLAVESDRMPYDSYIKLQEAVTGVSLKPLSGIVEELRAVKDAGEIEAISEASSIACQAFEDMLSRIKPGMTEKQIQVELEYAMLKRGAEAIAFQTIACAGPNGSLPHATPSDRPIGKGELLTLDFGAQVRGYKSDITRTVAIGPISQALRDIYQVVLDAQLLALSNVSPGVACSDVDKAARDYIDARYEGAFGHGLGHGVGLEIHERPNFSRLSEVRLAPGHVMTVEPGVYIKGLGGCRIEDTIVVTDGGYKNLMSAKKELIIL